MTEPKPDLEQVIAKCFEKGMSYQDGKEVYSQLADAVRGWMVERVEKKGKEFSDNPYNIGYNDAIYDILKILKG